MISTNAKDADAVAGFIALIRAETALWRRAEAVLRESGCVLPGTFDLLREIAAMGPCRVQDLANAMLITVGGASQAVDRAVRDGFAQRQPHPSDRRSHAVELTPVGRDALLAAEAVVAAVVREFWGAADHLDGVALTSVLQRLVRRDRSSSELLGAAE